ncbi:MAG: c-type cytochrome [Firmicutes bacterium]|nr:c-type cytochrome [Bacillota bacterium]
MSPRDVRYRTIGAVMAALCLVGAYGWRREVGQSRAAAWRQEAQVGQQLFSALCETCHGPDGNGAGGAPNLNNGDILQKYPTVSQLTTFIQQRMPASDPGVLTPLQARDLAVWIWSLNPPS